VNTIGKLNAHKQTVKDSESSIKETTHDKFSAVSGLDILSFLFGVAHASFACQR